MLSSHCMYNKNFKSDYQALSEFGHVSRAPVSHCSDQLVFPAFIVETELVLFIHFRGLSHTPKRQETQQERGVSNRLLKS